MNKSVTLTLKLIVKDNDAEIARAQQEQISVYTNIAMHCACVIMY